MDFHLKTKEELLHLAKERGVVVYKSWHKQKIIDSLDPKEHLTIVEKPMVKGDFTSFQRFLVRVFLCSMSIVCIGLTMYFFGGGISTLYHIFTSFSEYVMAPGGRFEQWYRWQELILGLIFAALVVFFFNKWLDRRASDEEDGFL
jgi:hypothetical protein